MKLELVARDHVVGLFLRKLFHDILTPNLNINMNVSLTNFSFDDGLRNFCVLGFLAVLRTVEVVGEVVTMP